MRASTRGQRIKRQAVATVELAVIMPALILIVLIAIDLGRAAYTFIALKNAVRAGAGYAIMNPGSGAAWSTAVQNTTKNEMQNQTGYNANNLTFLNGTPSVTTDANGPDPTMQFVTVTVQYPFQPFLPSVLGVGSLINLKATVNLPLIR